MGKWFPTRGKVVLHPWRSGSRQGSNYYYQQLNAPGGLNTPMFFAVPWNSPEQRKACDANHSSRSNQPRSFRWAPDHRERERDYEDVAFRTGNICVGSVGTNSDCSLSVASRPPLCSAKRSAASTISSLLGSTPLAANRAMASARSRRTIAGSI